MPDEGMSSDDRSSLGSLVKDLTSVFEVLHMLSAKRRWTHQVRASPVEHAPLSLDDLPLHLVLGSVLVELAIEDGLEPLVIQVERLVGGTEILVLRGGKSSESFGVDAILSRDWRSSDEGQEGS